MDLEPGGQLKSEEEEIPDLGNEEAKEDQIVEEEGKFEKEHLGNKEKQLEKLTKALPIDPNWNPSQKILMQSLHDHQKEDPEFYQLFPETLARFETLAQTNWEHFFEYPSFRLPIPIFVEEKDRKSFLSNQFTRQLPSQVDQKGCITFSGDRHQLGGYSLVKDVSFSRLPECYWHSKASDFDQKAPHKVNLDLASVIFAPESNFFQHFMDGALPKLVHSWPMTRQMKVITLNFHSPMIKAILEHLKIDAVEFSPGGFHVDNFFLGCRAPGTHPELWKKMHYLVTQNITKELEGSGEILPAEQRRVSLVYFPRGNAKNGRRVLNEEEVVSALSNFASKNGMDFLEFKPGNYGSNLKDLVKSLSSATIAVGAHGGALYNMLFAPKNLSLVEFIPSFHTNLVVHNIFWSYAALLGNRYYRFYANGGGGNVSVDIDLLLKAVRRAFADRDLPPNDC